MVRCSWAIGKPASERERACPRAARRSGGRTRDPVGDSGLAGTRSTSFPLWMDETSRSSHTAVTQRLQKQLRRLPTDGAECGMNAQRHVAHTGCSADTCARSQGVLFS